MKNNIKFAKLNLSFLTHKIRKKEVTYKDVNIKGVRFLELAVRSLNLERVP